MEGSWIFLSHSSKDINTIRKIRNEFENYGHNPLAFHLKCLNSKTTEGKKEIFDLLKREIDARNWFVFCDSENSRNSYYVSYERAYIMKSGKKEVWTIDLSQSWEQIKKKIKRISKDLSIFVSYDPKDRAYADPLVDLLRANDFTVWTDEDMKNSHEDRYTHSIVYGLLFMFISNHSIERNYEELDYILNNCNGGETIIPIFIGKPNISSTDEGWFRSGICFDISENLEEVDYTKVLLYLEKFLQSSRNN